jgi:hypothetical protein
MFQRFLLLVVLTFVLVGCGKSGFHAARGQLVYDDGSPAKELDGFQIVFEGTAPDGRKYSSTGTVNAEGKFEMFTDKPGDGAPAGKCNVLIEPKMLDSEREAPYPIDRKYRNFDTSGLTADVGPDKPEFKFTVERRAAKK